MRIDNVNRLPPTQEPVKSEHGGNEPASNSQSASALPDRVEPSVLARALEASSDSRVEALRQAVESGTYRVSSSELAESIIQQHLKP